MRYWLFVLVAGLSGCAVTEQEYPLTWDPLPPAAGGCAHFAGSYADRGEAVGARTPPSLTYGLLGHHSAWKETRRVDLSFPEEGVLLITAWGDAKPLVKQALNSKAGEFWCKDGRLGVRSKRWVAADVVAGREEVTIEFNRTDSQLVAYVREKTYGTIFAVVPIAGTAAHWYRFPRLAAR